MSDIVIDNNTGHPKGSGSPIEPNESIVKLEQSDHIFGGLIMSYKFNFNQTFGLTPDEHWWLGK